MDKFNSNNFNINKFNNPAFKNSNKANFANEFYNNKSNNSFANHLTPKFNLQRPFNYSGLSNIKMNNLAGLEKSLYMKELMNLPKEIKDILVLIQNTSKSTAAAKNLINLMSTPLNISALSEIMQKNGKEAVSKIISAMSEAVKQGADSSQLKETMKLINASISISGQDNQSQTLKSFMLLYLPWLPLQEGKDFELEVEISKSSESNDDTVLTIFIASVNYGNIKIIVSVNTPSFFDIFITCVKNFPKKDFAEKINTDNKKNSITTNISYDEKDEKLEEKKNHQAKVTISNLKNVTPYLLVLSNILIKNAIEFDNL